MGEALEIHVTLKTDDEVLSLRSRVCQLEAEAVAAQGKYNELEFRYRCECIVNMELVDLLRTSKVPMRPSLRGRPWEGPPHPAGVGGPGGAPEPPGGAPEPPEGRGHPGGHSKR